jgi:hypothetical protein
MCAGDVHVREVRAVGLVHVVVHLEDRCARGCDDRLEERMRRNWGRLEINLIYECAKESKLLVG